MLISSDKHLVDTVLGNLYIFHIRTINSMNHFGHVEFPDFHSTLYKEVKNCAS